MSIDWDKPLQTMEGYDVVLLTKEFRYAGKPLCCVMIESVCGYSRTFLYREDGSPVTISSPSIRNKTKKVTKWSNLYRATDGASVFIAGPWWDTEKAANEHGSQASRWIKSVEVTWDEPCD